MKRIGPGKRLRHVEVELFFLQQLVRQGVISIVKRDGKNHPPDICTKHLAWPDIKRLLAMLDVRLLTLAGVNLLAGQAGATSTEVTTGTAAEKSWPSCCCWNG